MQATTSPGNHSTAPGLTCRPDQIPVDLTIDDAPFVNFKVKPKKDGKFDKIPVNPTGLRNAKVDDPDTFGTFEQARANLGLPNVAGLSRIMTDDDDVVGYDWDGCVADDGAIAPEVLAEVAELGCYAELSWSGHGVRGFGRGRLPVDGRKVGARECYQAKRHLTVTGHHIAGTPTTLQANQPALDAWYLQHFGPSPAARAYVPPVASLTLADQDVLAAARAAKNGPEISALYDHGDLTRYGGDESRADLALADRLAFYTQDPAQLRRLLEASALRREKWAERRGSSTWLDVYVIDKALSDLTATYSGGRTWDGPILAHPDPTPHDAPWAPPPIPIMAGGGTCGQCPLAETPTVIARLEARVRELDARNRQLEAELAQVDGERQDVIRLVNNPHLKHEHGTLLATAYALEQARQYGKLAPDGSARIPLATLAKTTGQSEDTVSKHLKRAEQYKLVQRRYPRNDDGFPELYVRMANGAQEPRPILRTLAHWGPTSHVETVKHGGKRIPRCPDCPGAVIREEHRFICQDCGTVLLAEVTEHALPEATPHHAGRPSTPAPMLVAHPVTPTPSVEVVLETASCGVAPLPIERPCNRCTKPARPDGQPSCVHGDAAVAEVYPVLEVDPDPPEWPILDDEWAALADGLPDEEPLAVDPPPSPPDWCPVHRRRLWAYADQQLGACSTCAAEAAGATPMAEVG